MAVAAAGRQEVVVSYRPLGAARAMFHSQATELLLSGPAGTGKSRANLEKVHLCALKYAGMRGLIVRKTLSSLTATTLVTYREKVLHPLDGVTFFGGSSAEPPQFRYPNGSRLLVGGLDNTAKIMSAEYDIINVGEATEPTEAAWEDLTTRLRNGVMPYQQIIGDCNPGPPTHWLKRRADRGAVLMLESRHEDNPRLFRDGAWTDEGRVYIARLDALTGVRLKRLRHGIWAAAEGMVYDGWDPALHVIDPFPIPREWPRYWSVDFGYTHPFAWAAFAQDPDGRLYRYREIYKTQRLVEDHARDILALTKDDPRPRAIICDHDAEDRATLERHLKMSTVAAFKSVSPGIQAVATRLRMAGDGRPRLFFVRDALAERDVLLAEAGKPTCTEEEPEGYIWDISLGRKKGEEPVKDFDHGLDMCRYLVAHVDNIGQRRTVFRAATAGARPAVASYAEHLR